MIHRALTTAVVLATAFPSTALACGGFFCNRDQPVDQAGEDIVFAVDEEAGETTMHVQVTYTGDSEDFAWIVPVSHNPEILVSTNELFEQLEVYTRPSFSIDYVERWRCDDDRSYGYYDYDMAASSSGSSPAPEDGGVDVVQEGKVGPYEMVVLQADSTELLLGWLQDNDYDLPDSLDPVLKPYVADQSYFLALKLQKDRDTGDLVPLALTYPSTAASVPIQLTSVAATPDMRMHAYILGDSRAVPDSYLHVKVNDLVVDWFTAGSNYEEAITVAADEAGGHAFATDYSGSTEILDKTLYDEARYDIDALAAATDPVSFMNELMTQGFVGDDQLLDILEEFMPVPPSVLDMGVDPASFYNCVECYVEYLDEIEFDSVAAAQALDNRIVEPLRQAQELVDRFPHLTRLTSSVSPEEMTVDPTFVFNADMEQEITNDRRAKVEMLCGWGGSWSEAPRRLVLEDGRTYDLPSEQWFMDRGITEYEYLEHLMNVYALVIEETSDSGDPVVLVDHTEDAFDAAEAFNAEDEDVKRGCDVTTGVGGSTAALLLAMGLVARRRRED